MTNFLGLCWFVETTHRLQFGVFWLPWSTPESLVVIDKGFELRLHVLFCEAVATWFAVQHDTTLYESAHELQLSYRTLARLSYGDARISKSRHTFQHVLIAWDTHRLQIRVPSFNVTRAVQTVSRYLKHWVCARANKRMCGNTNLPYAAASWQSCASPLSQKRQNISL